MKIKEQTRFCKKLVYDNPENPRVVYGIIQEESEDFLIFLTGKRQYVISKKSVISIQDTDKIFQKAEAQE